MRMTKVQTQALKIWAISLWSLLWCSIYFKRDVALVEMGPDVNVGLWVFCLIGWFWPMGIGPLWRLTQKRKHELLKQRG